MLRYDICIYESHDVTYLGMMQIARAGGRGEEGKRRWKRFWHWAIIAFPSFLCGLLREGGRGGSIFHTAQDHRLFVLQSFFISQAPRLL